MGPQARGRLRDLARGRANPEGITLDNAGNVFVADFEVKGSPPGHVVAFDRQGRFLRDLTIAGSSNLLLGIAFQRSTGKLLVIDFGNGQVLSVDPVTGAATPFVVMGPGSGLNGLTFDRAGNVYISDSFQGAIFKAPPTGGAATLWKQDPLLTTTGVPPFGANGLAFDKAESFLFVANLGNDTIVRIANAGGDTGGAADVLTNSINGADGLAIDEHDNLWVCGQPGGRDRHRRSHRQGHRQAGRLRRPEEGRAGRAALPRQPGVSTATPSSSPTCRSTCACSDSTPWTRSGPRR